VQYISSVVYVEKDENIDDPLLAAVATEAVDEARRCAL
jgi:hypothetical protein